MVKNPGQIYQIKVSLENTHPSVWRRILVAENTTLLKLHDILQIVIGWTDSHLHMFTIDGTFYGDPKVDEYEDLGELDEKKYTLNQVLNHEGQRFTYQYDFGDSWEHTLVVESISLPQEGTNYPVCVKGKRACPPEDVGGVWGYESFLEALGDPQHPEHANAVEWLGEEFDPEAFNLEGVNAQLRSMGRGRSAETDNPWYLEEVGPGEHKERFDSLWEAGLPDDQRTVAKELPLRRDAITLLNYLRDHKVTGTQSTGNLPLKVMDEIIAQFIDPPPLVNSLGGRMFRSELDFWPLYNVHVLAWVGRLIDGGPARRWTLTQLGEQFLEADTAQQVWQLFYTWWNEVNWLIAAPIGYAGDFLLPVIKEYALPYLLEPETDASIPYEPFANRLLQAAGVELPPPIEKWSFHPLQAMIQSTIINPLTDFGILVREYGTHKTLGFDFRELNTFRITPFGKGLLEAMEKAEAESEQ